MSGRTANYRIAALAALSLALLSVAACGGDAKDSIVAASPTAITISTNRFVEPTSVANAHCAKHGRKAVARGGVKLGAVGYKTMWGYDCIKQ